MFDAIKETFRHLKAIRDWLNSETAQALSQHTDTYFEYPRLKAFNDKAKERIVSDFYTTISEIAKAENPFLTFRQYVAAYSAQGAEWGVLSLTEEEKVQMPYASNPYISGSLHRVIHKAADHVDELRELVWKHADISHDELVDFCNTRGLVAMYYVNGFNLLRLEFDDVDHEKDWYKPFQHAMLVWKEDQFREELGMPSLFPDDLGGFKYSLFHKYVSEGHKNPYYTWEMALKEIEDQESG